MKKLLILFVMAGMILTSCNPDNKWIETDYSNDIVGTWTCVEAGYAEALVIKADGTIVSTGVEGDHYWEDVNGTYEMVNNKMTMKFEDNDNFEGRFEMIPGETLVLVEPDGERSTYRYCAEDLSEEVIGMWVNNGISVEGLEEMAIHTFKEDGIAIYTGYIGDNGLLNAESLYKLVGDLLIMSSDGNYITNRMDYLPNGTELGDIMTLYNPVLDFTSSWLRIKQNLELSGNKYDYNATYISNVSGSDEEFEFMGHKFSIAGMDGVMMDKMLKALLFSVDFPDANTIKYSCYYEGAMKSIDVPIAVEGNKITVKMSEKKSVYRDLDVYAFQDVDNCQLHMYMSRTAFVNFFSNMQVAIMAEMGELDITDAAAVEAIYNSIDNAVETINLSFVFKH